MNGHREKEPAVNRLFLAITVLYLLISILLDVLAGRGVSVHLPLALSLISGELVLLVPTLLYMAAARPKLCGLSERWRLPLAAVPLLILMAYCILPLISLVNLLSMWVSGENAAGALLGPMQRLPLWASLLCVSVLPGFLEEFIFRGLFYGAYRERGVWKAIFVSALLFGLMHMNLNQMCYAFVMGVLFCLLYEATGSILSSMLVHAVFNGNSVLLAYLTDTAAYLEDTQGAALPELLFGSGGVGMQMLIAVVTIAIIACIGMAAAGGLYVAVVKLCGRGEQVKLLFRKNALEKRRVLMAGVSTEPAEGTNADMGGENAGMVSRKLWGPFLWLGVLLSVAVILWELLAL